jgi:hypothetical protein
LERWTEQRGAISYVVRFRHALLLLALAGLAVFALEPLLISGRTPLLARLSDEDRSSFYGLVIPVSASLLGFYIAAVAILAQLDPSRAIVDELKRGESFSLLIANMLFAILLLFALTFVGIAGSVVDGSCPVMALYEWLLLGTVLELALSGAFFSIVTYKVAVDKGKRKPGVSQP